MSMTIEQLVDEIKTLSPAEQQRLREQLLKATVPAAEIHQDSTEEEFKRRLLEMGFIKEIKRPPRDLQKAHDEFMKYQPIRIQGKPLSETIIEERR